MGKRNKKEKKKKKKVAMMNNIKGMTSRPNHLYLSGVPQ